MLSSPTVPRGPGRPQGSMAPKTFAPEDYLVEDLFDRVQELKLTYETVCARMGGANASNLSHIFNGDHNPRLKTVQALAAALGLKLILVDTR